MVLVLKQHQKEAIEFLSKRRCAFIQYEMGLGKTIIMLEHIKQNKKHFAPTLIVCPKNVVPVWGQEIEKWGYDLTYTNLLGTTLKRVKLLKNTETDLYIINYEALRLVERQLKEKKFRCIILDESHRIKERTSKQTEIVMRLGEDVTFKYNLSGTPIPKSPEDLWTQIYFLNKEFLPNYFAYCTNYIEYRKFYVTTPKGKRVVRKALHLKKSKNQFGIPKDEELRQKLSPLILRRTKKECLDLPDKIYKRIDVDLTKEQKLAYLSVRGDLKQIMDEGRLDEETARGSVAKLQQICQGFLYDQNGTNPKFFKSSKIEALKDLLQDLEDKKIILFTWFKADIENILNNIKDREILVYDGSDDNRKLMIKKFQEEDKPYIFLSNIERAKEGITLTEASDVIYFGNSYNYASRVQSEDRPHRVGQKNNVVYYDIVVNNTVDERVTSILLGKKKIANEITGDSIRLAMMEMENRL